VRDHEAAVAEMEGERSDLELGVAGGDREQAGLEEEAMALGEDVAELREQLAEIEALLGGSQEEGAEKVRKGSLVGECFLQANLGPKFGPFFMAKKCFFPNLEKCPL